MYEESWLAIDLLDQFKNMCPLFQQQMDALQKSFDAYTG